MNVKEAKKKVDRDARAEMTELRKIEARIKSMLRRNEDNAWAIGHLVDRIATERLHHGAGFTTLDEYLTTRFTQGASTLRRYRRVAIAFERASVLRHGTERLEAGLTYLAATKGTAAPPRTLLSLLVHVPTDGRQGETYEVPFKDASLNEIQRAIIAARARPEPKDAATQKLAKRMQEAVQAAVAAPEGSYFHAPQVRVTPHPEKKGAVRIDVMGIDADDLHRVGEALRHVEQAESAKGNAKGAAHGSEHAVSKRGREKATKKAAREAARR